MTFQRITIDPDQMGGVACIGGRRLPVATVVSMVADGMTEPEILEACPYLVREARCGIFLWECPAPGKQVLVDKRVLFDSKHDHMW